MESEIVIDDCNKHAQTSESTISYEHVNFFRALGPCENNQIKEDYCTHHRNEKTRMWDKALNELGEKVCSINIKWVISISNVQAMIVVFLIQ
jgi:hypothetical protein